MRPQPWFLIVGILVLVTGCQPSKKDVKNPPGPAETPGPVVGQEIPAPAPGTQTPAGEENPEKPGPDVGLEGVPADGKAPPGGSPTAPGQEKTEEPLPQTTDLTLGPVVPQEGDLFPSSSAPIPGLRTSKNFPGTSNTSTFREAMLHGREFLLERIDYLRPVFPRDYALGRLQGYLADTPDMAKAIQAAQEFLTGILGGQVAENLLQPQWKVTIQTTLEDSFREKLIPRGFRLGVLKTFERGLVANVALLGTPGTARGQIYLEKDPKGIWKISDFQMNLAEMKVPPPKTEEPYNPGAFPFLEGI